MRYVRTGDVCYIQWLDKRSVTILSTQHKATDHSDTTRRIRVDGAWVDEPIPRPKAVADYNEQMGGGGGVDSFDQLASSYRLLRRSKKSRRCIFYALIEVATINSFILFQEFRRENGGLECPASYSQFKFRANLVRQPANIGMEDPPPVPTHGRKRTHAEMERLDHLPICNENRGDCIVCCRNTKAAVKTSFTCSERRNARNMPAYFCIEVDRQCFHDYHRNL